MSVLDTNPRGVILWTMGIAIALDAAIGVLMFTSAETWLARALVVVYIGGLITLLALMGRNSLQSIRATDRFYANEANAMMLRMDEIPDPKHVLRTPSLEINLPRRVVTMDKKVSTQAAYSELKDLWATRGNNALAYEFPLTPYADEYQYAYLGDPQTGVKWYIHPDWTLRNWELTA